MPSWPETETPWTLDAPAIAAHHDAIRDFLAREGLDALVVTSSDPHLNEYTPLRNNHRYLLTGFTGSTALLLVPREGRARLHVDGRYHLQVDGEIDADRVEAVKVRFGSQLEANLLADLAGLERVAFDASRVSDAFADRIRAVAPAARALSGGEIAAVLGGAPAPSARPLERIPAAISGRDAAAKLAAVRAELRAGDAIFLLAALDDLAWLTDLRGYHFARQSSFAATGFITSDEIHVCLDPALRDAPRPEIDPAVRLHFEPLEAVLGAEPWDERPRRVLWDRQRTTAALPDRLRAVRPEWSYEGLDRNPVVAVRARKTAAEIAHFEAMNARSSRAVAETFRWLRRELGAGRPVSELDFRDRANENYRAEGARDLSFSTIAASGPDSAIIHFSASSPEVLIRPDDLVLLDSGAYYEGGFATDITRTALAGGRAARASDRQREIHTLVLKGFLAGIGAICPDGTPGSYFDTLCRRPLHATGQDYAHGTGHGVGINVHEAGIGLSPTSSLPLHAGHVCSIEPGLYVPGFGGVRIENVVVFEDDPEHPGFLRNRSLNHVGIDPHLVDRDRLDERERVLLDDYQDRCRAEGTLLEDD
ncbi:MAG: M24 family metallopeptidase [Planctomycetota bacterium]